MYHIAPHGSSPLQDKATAEVVRRHLHALAYVDGHEGPSVLRLKLLVDDASQAGNPAGVQR